MFVHLTLESLVAGIRRSGISRMRRVDASSPRGVFAVPVTRNFYASHQWLRELKRRSAGPLVGVYFRIPDEEQVWVGHYGKAHRLLSAAEAIAQFATADAPLGWEVVIPRRIEARGIHKTRRLSQVIGSTPGHFVREMMSVHESCSNELKDFNRVEGRSRGRRGKRGARECKRRRLPPRGQWRCSKRRLRDQTPAPRIHEPLGRIRQPGRCTTL